MSTNSLIDEAYSGVAAAWTAVEEMGGTVAEQKNLANLEAGVASIPNEPPLPDLPVPDLTKVLGAAEFSQLQDIVDTGRASEYLELGQNLRISYSNGARTQEYEIVGFEPIKAKVGDEIKTLPAINLLARYTTRNINWGSTNSAYSSSDLRSRISGSPTTLLDADFVACLAFSEVNTLRSTGPTDTVYDKLFAPSAAQLGIGLGNYNNSQQQTVEGPTFTSYKGASAAQRIKHSIDAPADAQEYWLRTYATSDITRRDIIQVTGGIFSSTAGSQSHILTACNFIGKNQ